MAIIGDTKNLVPDLMHKGHMSHRIQVIEQSGHSSKPSLGVNAIEIMYQVIGNLISLQEKMAINYANYSFDTPSPTLSLDAIQGRDNANRIYGYYQLDIHMRSLPSMNVHELVQLLSDALAPLAEKYPDRISFDEFHPALRNNHQPNWIPLLKKSVSISAV